MKIGKLIINSGSQVFICLLILLPVAAIISVGGGSNGNLLVFVAKALTVLPSLGLFMAGFPEDVARALSAGLVSICAICFVARQYWRIAEWRSSG